MNAYFQGIVPTCIILGYEMAVPFQHASTLKALPFSDVV